MKFYRLVTEYIRRRIRDGAFRNVNPEIAARGLIGMISYHGLVGILFPGRLKTPDRKRIVAEMVTIFLDGIASPR